MDLNVGVSQFISDESTREGRSPSGDGDGITSIIDGSWGTSWSNIVVEGQRRIELEKGDIVGIS